MTNSENNKIIAFPGGSAKNKEKVSIGNNKHKNKRISKLKIFYLISKKLITLKPVKIVLGSCAIAFLVMTVVNVIPKGNEIISVGISKGESFEENFSQNLNSMSEESKTTMMEATSREDLADSKSTNTSEGNSESEDDAKSVLSEDLVAVLTPQLEGENCAYYLAEIKVVLPQESLIYEDGKYSYNIKDADFEVIDVKPDMADEQVELLPQDILEDIYEEAETLKRQVRKELKKSKGRDFLKDKIDEKLSEIM